MFHFESEFSRYLAQNLLSLFINSTCFIIFAMYLKNVNSHVCDQLAIPTVGRFDEENNRNHSTIDLLN